MCGTFIGGGGEAKDSKHEGCEAMLFAERGCRMYVNTVVFRAAREAKPVGGWWRSLRVRCGVEVPEQGEGGLEGLLGGGGGGRRGRGRGEGRFVIPGQGS